MERKTDSLYLGVSVDVRKTEKRNRHHVQLLARFNFAENKATQVTRNITGAQERLSKEMKEAIKHLIFFNPFLLKGLPIDDQNGLALDGVKSTKVLVGQERVN